MLALLAALHAAALAVEPSTGAWVWGDLHAHSGWSYDGCEDAEAQCAPRGEIPGSDFFAEAEAVGLDFAALTDHAEGGTWQPTGEDGLSYDVWDGQAAAVQEAEGGPTLPVLGYEWSAFRDEEHRGHPEGTHRTVLLNITGGCEEARAPGFSLEGGERIGPDSSVFVQTDAEPLEVVSDLWESLDAAAERCAGLRWITFAHHSAYTNPQVTDWSLKENRPDRETLIEVASEHGSSECLDLEAPGCDFWINDSQGYWADGSVQAALEQGYALGFVGGTDSHDARPGSLDDGPGSVGQLNGDGSVRVQDFRGAITGVWLEEGQELTVHALFDALEARRTMASTGPRPALTATAEGADGETYLVGASLPRDALPATLRLELEDPGEGWTLTGVELIGEGGQVLAEGASAPWSETWDGRAGEYAYLRLALARSDGGSDRVWISPWFVERRCGCTTADPAREAWFPLLLVGLLGLARRGGPRLSARCQRRCA